FSEPDGKFPYENFLSNEWNLQKVIPALKSTARPGEVYIGVGPDQNFTYAVALKAKMAFVLDIRRQNMLEHLLYKALFELSPTRGDFVSRLFSRKRPAGLDEKADVAAMFAAFEKLPSDADLFVQSMAAVKSNFRKHGYQLSNDDMVHIEFVYQVFMRGGPKMDYQFSSAQAAMSQPPSYSQLMTGKDSEGNSSSYLASEENFQFVREMQRKNLLIPLVGDFAGPKTIRRIGQYLKDRKANVSAFYASNVESYLDEKQTQDFHGNLLSLPSDSTTTVIRLVDSVHSTSLSWFKPTMSFVQTVSPMTDLVNLSSGGKTPSFHDLLRLIKEPPDAATLFRR
ncbi:MAG TPA: hypothetical protein VFO86_03005, partial [Terriglobia bacterium]|nr:hypothetical protein [Terriglobia bacterium]